MLINTAEGQEDFSTYEPAEFRDIRALGYITQYLMQGYLKEDGAVGVDDLVRWPLDSDAVKFLSQTTSITSIAELMKVGSNFVNISCCCAHIL